MVPQEEFKLSKTDKMVATHRADPADSGSQIDGYHCKQCHSFLFSTSSGIPEQIIVKLGTLDKDSLERFKPQQRAEMFVKHRMPFLAPVPDAAQFDAMFA